MEVSHAVVSALIGATARFASDVVTGDLKGTSNHVYIGGSDARNGKPFLFYEFPAGGTGGFAESDGNNATRNFTEGDFASIQSVEVIEQGQPLKIRELSLRADSGGAGAHRGGLGLHRGVEVLAESALLSISSDKNVIPPFGVLGGGPGKPNRFSVARGGETLAPSGDARQGGGLSSREGGRFRHGDLGRRRFRRPVSAGYRVGSRRRARGLRDGRWSEGGLRRHRARRRSG